MFSVGLSVKTYSSGVGLNERKEILFKCTFLYMEIFYKNIGAIAICQILRKLKNNLRLRF